VSGEHSSESGFGRKRSERYACQLVNQLGGTQRPRWRWCGLRVKHSRAISSQPADMCSHCEPLLEDLLNLAVSVDDLPPLGPGFPIHEERENAVRDS